MDQQHTLSRRIILALIAGILRLYTWLASRGGDPQVRRYVGETGVFVVTLPAPQERSPRTRRAPRQRESDHRASQAEGAESAQPEPLLSEPEVSPSKPTPPPSSRRLSGSSRSSK